MITNDRRPPADASTMPAEPAWHALPAEEAARRLDSGPEGLDASRARERLARFGRNELEVRKGPGPLRLLLRQFASPLIYLLAAAAAVSLATGHAVDAAVILAVILLNSLMGFFQEYRAEQALDALRRMTTPQARVVREGRLQVVRAVEVAPGDLLVLETGDTVGADGRIVAAEDLEIDESVLTGESEPVAKETGPLEESAALADRRNMAWMSTAVTGGRGRAVVVATGMRTELGRIADSVSSVQQEQTPLQQRIGRLSVLLGGGGVGFAVLVFGLGLLRGYAVLDMILFAVAVAVSAIPEGLPAVINVTLALGVQRMAARNAIIRRLPAVETLGSTTVICSDKTGTITRNEMTVVRLWADGKDHAAEDPPPPLLAEIGARANNARRIQGARLEGSPTDRAILAVSRRSEDGGAEGRDPPRLAEIPFSSRWKYMAVRLPGRIYVKGAPERILSFCSHIQEGERRVDLDEERRARVLEANERFAGEALRVIAGAYRDTGPADADGGPAGLEAAEVESGLTFVGLWGVLDPPREEATRAIAAARGAGIHVVMITGDHAATAIAIARSTGIAPPEARAVTGTELDRMDGEAIARAAFDSAVFARVTPGHKLKILEALKRRRQIVAMTGDGVNDAPALKAADIGVSMGRTGTEVAKGAADMILADDNFATIVHAVEEGRVVFANLQRVIYFLLATNLGEVLTLAAALLLGLPLPLSAVMILWVNLVTDGACTVPLGMEPGRGDMLHQPPRPTDAPVLDRPLVRRLILTSVLMAAGTLGLFFAELRAGSLPHARSMAFTTMVAFQWFQAFNARSRVRSLFSVGLTGNRWLLLGVGAAVLLQVLALHTGFGNRVFGTVPLSLADWAILLAVAASVWVLDEILKLLGLNRPRLRGRLPGR